MNRVLKSFKLVNSGCTKYNCWHFIRGHYLIRIWAGEQASSTPNKKYNSLTNYTHVEAEVYIIKNPNISSIFAEENQVFVSRKEMEELFDYKWTSNGFSSDMDFRFNRVEQEPIESILCLAKLIDKKYNQQYFLEYAKRKLNG